MNKPHWEKLHDGWIKDIRFELWFIWKLKLMLRKHPDDEMGEIFREMIKFCKKGFATLLVEYKKIYGDKPDVAMMRMEIDNV